MNKKELIKKIEELENEDVTLSDLRKMFASLEGYGFGRLDKNKYSTFYVYVMYHNKKVFPKAYSNGIEGVGFHPIVVNII